MDIELLNEPSTELTVQGRAALALSSDKTRKDLIAMAAKSAHLVEVKNKAARDEIHSAAMVLVSARTAISKTGKAARDDATKFSKAVIAEEASLIAITEPEEKRLLALRDAWDEVVAAEKAAREAAERTRVMGITERIAGIRQYVELVASCRTVERMQALQDKLAEMKIEGFEEFEDEARQVWQQTGAKVEELLNAKREQEAEQERIKAEQQEAALKLARERDEFRAQQAAAKEEADRLAAQVAAMQAAQAAKAKAEADAAAAELAIQRAAFEAEAAEARAIVAANKARLEQQQAEDTAMAASHEEEVKQAPAPVSDDGPSDAEVMWIAICAVAQAYGMTTEQATARLAAVQWTL